MSAAISNGPPAALQIEGDKLTAIHNGHDIPLPVADTAVAQQAYLQEVKKHEPRGLPQKILTALDEEIARYQPLAEAEREKGKKLLRTAGYHPVPVVVDPEDQEELPAFQEAIDGDDQDDKD
jgi:hypothetical protein